MQDQTTSRMTRVESKELALRKSDQLEFCATRCGAVYLVYSTSEDAGAATAPPDTTRALEPVSLDMYILLSTCLAHKLCHCMHAVQLAMAHECGREGVTEAKGPQTGGGSRRMQYAGEGQARRGKLAGLGYGAWR